MNHPNSYTSETEPAAVPAVRTWPWFVRVLAIFTGVGLGALLITAACLSPSERGYGTHQQLGLPECTFYAISGMPCPSCGMTTSWSHTMRGQILQAADANVGGLLLAVASLISVPWLFVSGLLGRSFFVRPGEIFLGCAALTIFTITVLDWAIRKL